jgi:hypothetical protein
MQCYVVSEHPLPPLKKKCDEKFSIFFLGNSAIPPPKKSNKNIPFIFLFSSIVQNFALYIKYGWCYGCISTQ